jgi:hypothetical protein
MTFVAPTQEWRVSGADVPGQVTSIIGTAARGSSLGLPFLPILTQQGIQPLLTAEHLSPSN